MDVLRDMKFLKVTKVEEQDENFDEPSPSPLMQNAKQQIIARYIIRPTREPSSLGGSAEIPIVLDGTIIPIRDSQYVFDLHINQLESVEQLTPIESQKYTASAPYGVVVVTTRKLGPPAPKDAKGTRCWPDGLERLPDNHSAELKAPETPGDYRIIADVVTHDGKVKTLTRKLTVTTK